MPKSYSQLLPSVERRLSAWISLIDQRGRTEPQRSRPTITISRRFGCEAFSLSERLKRLLDRGDRRNLDHLRQDTPGAGEPRQPCLHGPAPEPRRRVARGGIHQRLRVRPRDPRRRLPLPGAASGAHRGGRQRHHHRARWRDPHAALAELLSLPARCERAVLRGSHDASPEDLRRTGRGASARVPIRRARASLNTACTRR